MVQELFTKLKEMRVNIQLVDGKMDLEAPKGVLTQELLTEIRSHKKELIALIHSYQTEGIAYSAVHNTDLRKDYPLSSSQRMLWIVSQFEEGNIAYNMPGVYVFGGRFDLAAFSSSFEALLKRHESLRTVFREVRPGEVRQFVLSPEEIGFEIALRDLRDDKDREETVKSLVAELSVRPFNLSEGPMLRAALYQLEDHRWIFFYSIHHIISDGWSMDILIKELLQLYSLYSKGEEGVLPTLRIQYKDYVAWQQEQLSGESLRRHKKYWLTQFGGELPILELAGYQSRPRLKTYNGASVSRNIGGELTNLFSLLNKERDCTLFMGLVAAVNVLLSRYTGQRDLVIGTPVAGREHADLEDQIGFYVNTLALRIRFDEQDNFKQVLGKVREIVVGAHEHQAYPFSELVEALEGKRDMSRNPLFDVQVVLIQDAIIRDKAEVADLGGLEVSAYDHKEQIAKTSRFDLVFAFFEQGEGILVTLQYNTDIYSMDLADKLIDHLSQLMEAIVKAPLTPVAMLDFLHPSERAVLLSDYAGARLDYPRDQTVLDLFEKQAVIHPDHIAVVFERESITYRELRERSNQLAHYLRDQHHIQPDDLVGILLDRSQHMIIALLGVLKSGGAYVPIDPDYPVSRREYMIRDSRIKLLITQTEYLFGTDYYEGSVFCIDVQMESIGTSGETPAMVIGPRDLAYVIYTSGSTGQPKGVLIEHAGLFHFTFVSLFRYPAVKSSLLLSSIAFDMSVASIFGTLCCGGKLCLTSKEVIADIRMMADYLVENGVTHFFAVPSYYTLLLTALEGKKNSLEQVLLAGETCPPSLVASHFATDSLTGCALYNEYGPTECSVWATVHPYRRGEKILATIGQPIENTCIHILDAANQLMPAGMTGEICIAGPGLARGYLNQPGLTAEKFVPDPFVAGGTLYKTGDFGRWLADGLIDFVGRKDDQVKIRGYRIETREVECALQGYPGVDAAAVIAWSGNGGEDELVGYLVSQESLNISDLKAYLNTRLPAYAVPSHYVQLNALPLSSNGKTDKKQLPDPGITIMQTGVAYVSARNEMEERLIVSWEEILGRKGIGIKDSFFDLGGDSIKILKMVNELRKSLLLEIPVGDIYKNHTIEKLSDHIVLNNSALEKQGRDIKAIRAAVTERIESLKGRVLFADRIPDRDNIEDVYPMSDIEKGMVFEYLLHESKGIYHDQMIRHRSFADFDISRFRLAMGLMAEKHSILRTGFNINDYEEPVQIVYKQVPVSVHYEDLSGIALNEQELHLQAFTRLEFSCPFDVSAAPLWRMAAFNLGKGNITFVFQCHHGIIDGWSESLFLTELNNVYLQLGEDPHYKPQRLRSSYKDFVVQHEIDKSDNRIREFWKTELADCRRLELFTPVDQADFYLYSLNKPAIYRLEAMAKALNTTVKAISLSVYLYLMKVLGYENEVVAGVVTNTRPGLEDSDKVLGCFLNTVPFRMMVDGTARFSELISRVNAKLAELKSYDKLGLTEIAQTDKRKQESGNPYFDIFFNYIDFYSYESIKDDTRLAPNRPLPSSIKVNGNGSTNMYLDFTVNVTGESYSGSFFLSKKLKSGLSAARLGAMYFNILYGIIDAPHTVVRELDYLDSGEKGLLLGSFNDTAADYSREKTLTSLFEEQVKKKPGAIAVVSGGTELTYKELDERSNRLAGYLRSRYVIRADDLIGIQLERSEWMIIAILAVLKSGAAYMPIDPAGPRERTDYMLSDSRCKAFIDAAELEKFRVWGPQEADAELSGLLVNKPTDLAYVIYTSGSTGRPKGCLLEHRGVVNRLEWMWEKYAFTGEDRILQKTAFTFDVSVWEIFIPLCLGARMVLCKKEEAVSPERILSLIEEYGITCLHFVPGMLHAFMADLWGLEDMRKRLSPVRMVVTSGEALALKTVKQWYRGVAIPLHNLYGPTEASVDVTYYATSEQDKRIPIGSPIWNTQIYILGTDDQLVPIGATGEICIAGDGLSRGYLNNAELTREKFADNPFKEGVRMYRTGDLGRWLSDGGIEFIDRKDSQVKIRGYRVELGEIESVLQAYPDIEVAVVIVRIDAGGEKELVAYLSGKAGIDVIELRTYLSKALPIYMLPTRFVKLDKWPATASGKIDRKNLPEPEDLEIHAEASYEAPRNEREEKLVSAWQEVLDRKGIGIRDDFFESGGHSLKVLKLLSVLKQRWGIRLKIADIYNHPTIKGMSGHRSSYETMMRLSRHNSSLKKNIYFIPPAFGVPILYKPLAERLEDGFNCYAFQYRGLENDEPMYDSIGQAAMEFSDEISRHQKEDGFIILGYSMGAAIAFEMAKILEKKFKGIRLVLIDRTVSPKCDMQDQDALNREEAWLFGAYQKLMPDGLIEETALRRFMSNNLRVLNEYIQTGSVESPIHAFEAGDNKVNARMEDWGAYTTGGLKHCYLSGTHWEVLSESNLPLFEETIGSLFPNPEMLLVK